MQWSERLMPRSITTQITGLVAISVVLGMAFVTAIALLLFDPPKDSPIANVARVVDAARFLRAAESPEEVDRLLKVVRRTGLQVDSVAYSDLVPSKEVHLPWISGIALRQLASQSGIEMLDGMMYKAGSPSQIVTKLDESHALVFGAMPAASLWPIFLTPTAVLLMTVLVSALLLSIYAVRWIVAPLAEVATVAAAFGRSPQGNDLLRGRGPREIRQVADAINEMRTRIRALLEDRTRMLAAISHDLRTPLTRLQLRAERVGEESLRSPMLRDLTKVGRMLDETLDYLRDDARSEPSSRIDLSSFLQTICSDFSDMGHSVSYCGPARLSCDCRPRALSRAVTNVVENAVKHGNTVTVGLRQNDAETITIEIADDGPGIPPALRNRVFEPFFKGDDARSPGGGFGLGLSIAQDVVKRHGGAIEMHQGHPSGLRVLIILPCAGDGDARALPRAKMIKSIVGHTTLAEAERYRTDGSNESPDDAVIELEGHNTNKSAQTAFLGLGNAPNSRGKSR